MKPQNPFAFPIPPARHSSEFPTEYPSEGMTLRDYFAAKAMQGILSDSEGMESLTRAVIKEAGGGSLAQKVSQNAYAYADAMLAEREKQTT